MPVRLVVSGDKPLPVKVVRSNLPIAWDVTIYNQILLYQSSAAPQLKRVYTHDQVSM